MPPKKVPVTDFDAIGREAWTPVATGANWIGPPWAFPAGDAGQPRAVPQAPGIMVPTAGALAFSWLLPGGDAVHVAGDRLRTLAFSMTGDGAEAWLQALADGQRHRDPGGRAATTPLTRMTHPRPRDARPGRRLGLLFSASRLTVAAQPRPAPLALLEDGTAAATVRDALVSRGIQVRDVEDQRSDVLELHLLLPDGGS